MCNNYSKEIPFCCVLWNKVFYNNIPDLCVIVDM